MAFAESGTRGRLIKAEETAASGIYGGERRGHIRVKVECFYKEKAILGIFSEWTNGCRYQTA